MTANDRRGCLPEHLLRYIRTYVHRSMLCFGILCRSAWLSTFLAFRKFARVGLPFTTHHYKRRRRKVSFSSYKRTKEVDKRKKQTSSLQQRKTTKRSKDQSPTIIRKTLTIRTLPNPTPTIILPTRIPHNHTRAVLNF